MKRFLIIIGIMTLLIAAPAQAANVGVYVSIAQPGFYGQIGIGDFYYRPAVIYPQPIVVRPAPVYVMPQPVYYHVPPGHVKHGPYRQVYVPHHRAPGGPWVYGR
ncbi:MAG TPA: hypothetical protein PLR20_05530 [Syntrophales bacterium]|nr:hypothetical protein [Syntrophales bacterium]HPI58459.1 hypothetical protein [Syntrophales bacterium]HPN25959.1 hypothetical protein [Syntrophales bacterium]HQM28797.1 hypothetical protein [Syntrophales bacterium]